jgi:hypothetical protein
MATPGMYRPSDWYWIVGGSTTIVYSSKSATYVAVTDAAYATFVAAGGRATKIDNETDLQWVFAQAYPAGWTSSSSASAAAA